MAIQVLAQGIEVDEVIGIGSDLIYDNTGSTPIRRLLLKIENNSGFSVIFRAWLRSNDSISVSDANRIGIHHTVPDDELLYVPLAEIPAGYFLRGGVGGISPVRATLEEYDP